MTDVTVVRNDDGDPVGFEASGHSLSAESGNDIVCASISTLFEFLSTAVESLPQNAVQFDQSPEDPSWQISVCPTELSDREWYATRKIFTHALVTFRTIAGQHPDACRVNERNR